MKDEKINEEFKAQEREMKLMEKQLVITAICIQEYLGAHPDSMWLSELDCVERYQDPKDGEIKERRMKNLIFRSCYPNEREINRALGNYLLQLGAEYLKKDYIIPEDLLHEKTLEMLQIRDNLRKRSEKASENLAKKYLKESEI